MMLTLEFILKLEIRLHSAEAPDDASVSVRDFEHGIAVARVEEIVSVGELVDGVGMPVLIVSTLPL